MKHCTLPERRQGNVGINLTANCTDIFGENIFCRARNRTRLLIVIIYHRGGTIIR